MVKRALRMVRAIKISRIVIPALVLAALFAGWMTFKVANEDWEDASEWEERGQRGDYWGGHVAAGASVVANLFLIVTLLLQREELVLQRHDLRATRQEMIESRQVAERQEEAMREQVVVSRQAAELAQILSLETRFAEMRSVANITNRPFMVGKRTKNYETWASLDIAQKYVNLWKLMDRKVEQLIMPKEESILLREFLSLIEDDYFTSALKTIELHSS